MPKPKPFVGSYSKFKALETCPLQFYHLYVAQDVKPLPMGPEAREGDEVHKWLAKALKLGLDLPHSLKEHQWMLDTVRRRIEYQGPGVYESPKQIVLAETKRGLCKGLKPCDFFGKDVVYRSIADVEIIDREARTCYIVDYKTGKLRVDMEQLDLMAMVAFLYHKDVNEVTGQLLFSKHPEEDRLTRVYIRDDLDSLTRLLAAKYKEARFYKKMDAWPANRSGLCKQWCPVTADKCPHSGRT
jgi:hypothetical protein